MNEKDLHLLGKINDWICLISNYLEFATSVLTRGIF